jgi:hypothetical protein
MLHLRSTPSNRSKYPSMKTTYLQNLLVVITRCHTYSPVVQSRAGTPLTMNSPFTRYYRRSTTAIASRTLAEPLETVDHSIDTLCTVFRSIRKSLSLQSISATASLYVIETVRSCSSRSNRLVFVLFLL